MFVSLKSGKPELEFAKPVTIQLPIPEPHRKSNDDEANVKVFRCETVEEEEPTFSWTDITDEVALAVHSEDKVVQFEVQHFCW